MVKLIVIAILGWLSLPAFTMIFKLIELVL